ncbi:glycosyltransferase [Candidatus Halobeggiatoa sp. HSG11]|nr:glycosyltransferase [Candidatus Halobeggiatoa sp. HSG11]
MKNIILHDYFESLEGGGKLSSVLARGLNMDIGYGFANKNHPFIENLTQYSLNSRSSIPLWKQFKLAKAFNNHTDFLKNYETVIYSGFYTPLAINNHTNGKNILYCHTPPRFIYDQKKFYLKRLPIHLRPLLLTFIKYLQPRYEHAVANMDIIIANSENVSQRIQHYLGKQSTVIHPPCDTKRFQWLGQENYYLSMGRLDPLKRIDLIVQAFLKMPDKKLIIASGGEELPRLQKLAKQSNNIHLTGWVDEQKLTELVGKSIATLYLAKDEDFGMSPVESMAAGKPVIGTAEGGLLETIIPFKTGFLLQPSVSAICQAVSTMTPKTALNMRNDCEKQAQNFRTEIFLEKMQHYLN